MDDSRFIKVETTKYEELKKKELLFDVIIKLAKRTKDADGYSFTYQDTIDEILFLAGVEGEQQAQEPTEEPTPTEETEHTETEQTTEGGADTNE